jgi:hypothetical protein
LKVAALAENCTLGNFREDLRPAKVVNVPADAEQLVAWVKVMEVQRLSTAP